MSKTVFLKGGFGNQLFQFFTVFNNLNSPQDKIILDGSLLDKYPSKRNFELEFLLNDFVTYREKKIFNNSIFRYFLEVVARLRLINSDNGGGLVSSIYFGYFQSKDNFLESHSKIKLEEIFDRLKCKVNHQKMILIKDDFKYSYHFRLSDRSSDEIIDSFIHYIEGKHSKSESILIFTESTALLRSKLMAFNITYSSDLQITFLEEFYLLSIINNLQISSSTFSLFARLLSGNKIEFIESQPVPGDQHLVKEFSNFNYT